MIVYSIFFFLYFIFSLFFTFFLWCLGTHRIDIYRQSNNSRLLPFNFNRHSVIRKRKMRLTQSSNVSSSTFSTWTCRKMIKTDRICSWRDIFSLLKYTTLRASVKMIRHSRKREETSIKCKLEKRNETNKRNFSFSKLIRCLRCWIECLVISCNKTQSVREHEKVSKSLQEQRKGRAVTVTGSTTS